MLKVKITALARIGSENFEPYTAEPGDIVDVDEQCAASLFGSGQAVPYTEAMAAADAKVKTKSKDDSKAKAEAEAKAKADEEAKAKAAAANGGQ